MVDRKNFSFYMADDFAEKIDKVQQADDRLKSLSRSQAIYFIISSLHDNTLYLSPIKPANSETADTQ